MQRILHRLSKACLTRPSKEDWKLAVVLLLLYGLVYLPIGLKFEFLKLDIQTSSWTIIRVLAGALLMPGLTEELFFRALLLPHPSEPMTPRTRWLWIGLSWLSFVAWHPLNPDGPPFLGRPIFLLGAGLLGIICTIAYLRSGSLWVAIVMHWLTVVVWLLLFGGLARFQHW